MPKPSEVSAIPSEHHLNRAHECADMAASLLWLAKNQNTDQEQRQQMATLGRAMLADALRFMEAA